MLSEHLIRVLLIEDDPMVQEVNRMFIQKVDGFSVTGVASSGDEGIRLARELQPHLILLDIYMPVLNGLTVISEIREQNIDVDIIAVTAANDTETVKVLMRYGIIDYIVKPFTFERLQRALRQYKDVYAQLNSIEELSQAKLDEMMAQKEVESEKILPKGLHGHTLTQIINHVKSLDTAHSTEEIAAAVGLARVTVRRYLNYLHAKGEVEMELVYGTIGRPIQMYRYSR